MAIVMCPKCKTVSPLGDALLGCVVRCKNCNVRFLAAAMQTDASAPPSTISLTKSKEVSSPAVIAAPPTITSPAAVPATADEDSSEVIPVVARRIGMNEAPNTSPARLALRAAVFVMAALALLLPISCAGAFVFYRWSR